MLDCDVTFNAENYELSEPDAEAVAEIFDDLEFRRLKDQFVKIFSGEAEASVGAAVSNTETAKKIETASKKAAQAGAGQYNLFDANSTIADDVEEASSRQTIKSKEHHYQSVATSGMGLKLFLQNLNKQTSVCFDTETTGLNPLTAELVGIAFSWDAGKGFYLPFSDNKEEAQLLIEELRPFFENEDINLAIKFFFSFFSPCFSFFISFLNAFLSKAWSESPAAASESNHAYSDSPFIRSPVAIIL